ncbi:hypothetical protein ACIA8G_35310 [Lentzea sp. NPDC051213]|uniref:hypothetical protein n=1 Tax=Lentzea sp. NPDC051213 TaxID=3364126 RepID=UPI0037A97499
MSTTPELELVPVTRKLRHSTATTGDGDVTTSRFYCPACDEEGHVRATTFTAARDLETHRCAPDRTQTVAVVWIETPGLLDRVVDCFAPDESCSDCPQDGAAMAAQAWRGQLGAAVKAGLFVVPAFMTPSEAAAAIEIRLAERDDS